MTIVGLIPARSGSERVKDKNVKCLGGHPLLAFSIASALESGLFDAGVFVSTDSKEYAKVAREYGAKVIMRPWELASSVSPDIGWVQHALDTWKDRNRPFEFAILRPTSPFRSAGTIKRAFGAWNSQKGEYDSLRAVQPVSEHPGKQWVMRNGYLTPLLLQPNDPPWHSSQMASLPKVYVQNASLEIAFTRTVFEMGSIAGDAILPFLTEDAEGFDINTEYDFDTAERMVERGDAALPEVTKRG